MYQTLPRTVPEANTPEVEQRQSPLATSFRHLRAPKIFLHRLNFLPAAWASGPAAEAALPPPAGGNFLNLPTSLRLTTGRPFWRWKNLNLPPKTFTDCSVPPALRAVTRPAPQRVTLILVPTWTTSMVLTVSGSPPGSTTITGQVVGSSTPVSRNSGEAVTGPTGAEGVNCSPRLVPFAWTLIIIPASASLRVYSLRS